MTPQSENNLTLETQEISNQKISSPLCQVNCKTCNSLHLEEIHKKRLSDNLTFRELSSYVKKKWNEDISHSALHSHFKNFHKFLRTQVEKKMIVYLEIEADKRGKHSAQLTTLIDAMFEKIGVNWNQINPSIENLEKLIKLRYAVMEGRLGLDDFDDQMRALIQHADKVNVNQLSLFSPAPPPAQKPDDRETQEN